MEKYAYVQHLYQMADQSATQGDWQRLYLARCEMNRVSPSTENSLWQADAGRMLGLLSVEGSFGPEEIGFLRENGPSLFPHLFAAAIEQGGISTSDLATFDISMFSGNDRLVRAVSYAILHRGFETSELESMGVSEHGMISIRDFPNKSSQLVLEASVIDVSGFLDKIKAPAVQNRQIEVESAEVIRLKNALVWIESDVQLVEGQFVADQATKLGGSGVDFGSDSRVMASTGGKVIITSNRSSVSKSVKRGLFLGYPMSREWGHFHQSILTRLAFALEIYSDGDLDLILSSRVTQQGRDAIRMMHPNLRLYFFDPGTEISVEELLIVPSRGYTPEQLMPGSQMDLLRLTTDIDAMRIIRKRFEKSRPNISTLSATVYWSRQSATYRKGPSDQILQYLAAGHGLDIVDLGNLNFIEQCDLVGRTNRSFGFRGSYLHNVACLAPMGSSHLIVTNDRPYEWQVLFVALTELLGQEPLIIQGSSRLSLPFYSPTNFHSATDLSSEQIEFISELMVSGKEFT